MYFPCVFVLFHFVVFVLPFLLETLRHYNYQILMCTLSFFMQFSLNCDKVCT